MISFPNTAIPDPYESVFDRHFDTAVFGAGFIGFAAARTLAAKGHQVLLVEASGDLLWEATRALENIASIAAAHPAWLEWLETLQARSGANDAFFDPALAEILAAQELSSAGPELATLLYATPIALEKNTGGIASVTVATKNGLRLLRARQWIDATEQGLLGRLAQPLLPPRRPSSLQRSLVLQSFHPEKLDALAPALAERHPETSWIRSLRGSERRLRWAVGGEPWHGKAVSLIRGLRELSADGHAADFIVSHCAMRNFPVYAALPAAEEPPSLPPNLVIPSPSLGQEAVASPACRFALGVEAASRLSKPSSVSKPAGKTLPPSGTPETRAGYDVLVAGTGTAGAVAALAAARAGARTFAVDFTSCPGGIGTGGGINGYFHGARGGLQAELDRRSSEMTALLTGRPAGLDGWHHDAKKLALLGLFDEEGITFLGDALVCGVEQNAKGHVLAVLAVADGRFLRITARFFIDATGDGDLCALAGAGFDNGREGDGRTLAYSQSVFYLKAGKEQMSVGSCNFDAGWVDATDPEDLSQARLRGIAQHFRENWTGHDRPIAVSPLLGLRHSRLIHTDHAVALDDMITHARFDDSIGETDTIADTHSVDFEFESDELAFYYWTCRGFRHPLRCQLPYRMLLPRGLDNVWISCRAAGIQMDASYGLRMQRDMQRLGEAAGIAAALACSGNGGSRGVDLSSLQNALDQSGARQSDGAGNFKPATDEWIGLLDQGIPGVHLWHLYRAPDLHRKAVSGRLDHGNPRVSFYAAALLAMWKDSSSESRLLDALQSWETGPSPEEYPVGGAWGQCIDIPFWLQAVMLLRCSGTARCLPSLRDLAGRGDQPLNVRTLVARTLERLAGRIGCNELLVESLDLLLADVPDDSLLPPSHSLWRTLHGGQQLKLANDRGADTRQDHTWQLQLVAARTRKLLGLDIQPRAFTYRHDRRGFVRQAFALLLDKAGK